MTNLTEPVFYDCEATGIGGFPIEIGWAFVDGQNAICSEAHLIKPPPSWDLPNVWDVEAEAVHGITLQQLNSGMPTFQIVRRMNEVLKDRELFSDSPMDEFWLMKIYDEANEAPTFTIRRTDATVLIRECARAHGMQTADFDALKSAAERLEPRIHRAEPDARHLAQIWLLIKQTDAQRNPATPPEQRDIGE